MTFTEQEVIDMTKEFYAIFGHYTWLDSRSDGGIFHSCDYEDKQKLDVKLVELRKKYSEKYGESFVDAMCKSMKLW